MNKLCERKILITLCVKKRKTFFVFSYVEMLGVCACVDVYVTVKVRNPMNVEIDQ